MARWRRISKVFVRYWVANYWTWENGFRGSFTRRNKSWQNSKVETLDPQIESRRCSTTIKSTTWFCSSGKRMQEIFHEFLARTREENRTTPRSQQWRQRKAQVFEGIEEYDFSVDPRTDWRLKKQSQGDLSPSSSSTNWERNNWTTRRWNSSHSSR